MARHKHADVIHAWAEGEEIEYRPNPETHWARIENPCFSVNHEYRIKPKIVKREGWVNIYRNGYSFGYPTKNEADTRQSIYRDRLACIRIEWEEEE